jgi:hypothetical protein
MHQVIFYEQQLKKIIAKTILTAILKEAWNTAQQASDKREKIQALSLAKECYSMKLDLLTNATVVDDAIKFVSNHKNESEEKPNDSDVLPNLDSESNADSVKTHNTIF